MTKERHLPQLESIQRLSKIPVVESSVELATGLYGKIKNSNSLMKWYFHTLEGSVTFVIDKSLIAVPLIEFPLTVADTIVCKGLDTVQQRVPAINDPPAKIYRKTKDYVSTTFVQPVLKRAESAKELTINGATKYGELAASRIDTALNVADQYVEKYLPDASDTVDGKELVSNGESKTIQTIEHVNRLSRKLQRRLTKRTIAEARALKRQGVNTAHILMKLAELMIKDPKQFAARMKAIWAQLSEDEPENQVPPANLEQLINMITRETARRFVHLTNYTVKKASQLPGATRRTIEYLMHQANYILDQALKTVHLEGAKAIAISRAESQIRHLNITLRDVQLLIENLVSGLLASQGHKHRASEGPIPLHTLSPVAQSPERTQEPGKSEEQPTKNHADSMTESTQHSKPSSPKKTKKSKSNSSQPNSDITIESTNSGPSSNEGSKSNNQPTANGDTPKSPE